MTSMTPVQLNLHDPEQARPLQSAPYGSYGTGPKALRAWKSAHGRPTTSSSGLPLGKLFVAVFLPWVILLVGVLVVSFSVHYNMPLLCYTVVVLGFLLVLWTGKQLLDDVRNGEPMFAPFLIFVLSAVAWAGGVCIGQWNYVNYMRPAYDVQALDTYNGVNPNLQGGQSIMDAGQINFIEGTTLDRRRAMGFKNKDVYCVAPIVGPGFSTNNLTITNGTVMTTPLMSNYDFWAVGTNCCGGGSYRCGDWHDPEARGALRLMKDAQRPFFRLAVKQANVAYHIESRHPIFMHWLKDPAGEVAGYEDAGYKVLVYCASIGMCILLVFVTFAYIAYTKVEESM